MKPSVKYGLILGGVLAAFPLLVYALGMDKEESFQKISTIINLALISTILYLGIKEERDQHGNGFISFGKGFGTGIRISSIAALISMVFSYLYFTVINPGMVTYIKMKQEEELMNRGMSEEMIEKASANMDKWMSPEAMAGFSMFGTLLLGLVITLIVAALMKKEDPSAEIS
ncbi:MAG TPA: DUF4199 domain-containing protein [Bacteroidia bacterium]|nr:DUF4199 domain-containing protein [Bacteroidia bacterium]